MIVGSERVKGVTHFFDCVNSEMIYPSNAEWSGNILHLGIDHVQDQELRRTVHLYSIGLLELGLCGCMFVYEFVRLIHVSPLNSHFHRRTRKLFLVIEDDH